MLKNGPNYSYFGYLKHFHRIPLFLIKVLDHLHELPNALIRFDLQNIIDRELLHGVLSLQKHIYTYSQKFRFRKDLLHVAIVLFHKHIHCFLILALNPLYLLFPTLFIQFHLLLQPRNVLILLDMKILLELLKSQQ